MKTFVQSSNLNGLFNRNLVNQTNGENHSIHIDEKPIKNINDVFHDVDEKKIQSNTKDIETEPGNILQLRRNFTTAIVTTAKNSTETTQMVSTFTESDTFKTTTASITPLNNSTNYFIAAAVDDTAENMQRELLARRRRRRRHRLRKYKLHFK